MTTLDFDAAAVEALYPGPVAAAVAAEFAATAELVGPEHDAAVGMAPRRRQEFSQGRDCARRALQRLGAPPATIAKGADRAPVWPSNIVGSISHTGSIAAALVANQHEFRGVGLDIEQRGELEPDTARLILRPTEQQRFDAAEALLVFSIKEAIYKALYPSVGHFVDFQEMEVTLLPAQQRFTATPHPAGWDQDAAAGLSGAYLQTPNYVISAAWLLART